MIRVLSLVLVLKQQQFLKFNFIEFINGRSQTNWDQKSNLLLLQRHYQYQKFWVKLVKNWQKVVQKHWYLLHRIHEIGDCENIHSVNSLYLQVNHTSECIEEKNENKYLVFDSTDENKELLKKYADVWDGIKNEIKTINGGKENDYGKDYMKI